MTKLIFDYNRIKNTVLFQDNIIEHISVLKQCSVVVDVNLETKNIQHVEVHDSEYDITASGEVEIRENTTYIEPCIGCNNESVLLCETDHVFDYVHKALSGIMQGAVDVDPQREIIVLSPLSSKIMDGISKWVGASDIDQSTIDSGKVLYGIGSDIYETSL